MDVVGTFPIPIDEPIVFYKILKWNRRKNKIKRITEYCNFPPIAILLATGSDLKSKYLFSMNVEEKDITEEVLKREFECKGFQLPESFSIKEVASGWEIIDEKGGKNYYQLKNEDEIKIYENMINSAIINICRNDYPGRIKIVVVINGPNPPLPNDDELVTIKEELSNWWKNSIYCQNYELEILTLHNNKGNKATPLNIGYKFTDGYKYIITTDTKGHLVKSALKDLVIWLISDSDNEIGGVSGVITIEEGKRVQQRDHSIWEKWDFLVAEWSVRWSRLVVSPYVHASGGLAIYKKNVLEEIRIKRGEETNKICIVNSEITEVEEVFCWNSVVEDLEIAWRIHNLGYKILHEPKATYHGYAPNDFVTQYNRFRRWYGGFAQIFRFVGPGWKLKRWWVLFTGLIYSFFWIIVLIYMIFRFLVGDFSQLYELTTIKTNLIDYTPIGGILSFINAYNDWSFQPLFNWWTDFFKIAISEFIMCFIDFLIAIILGYTLKISDNERAIPNPCAFLPYIFIAPIVIIFNRFYWVIFGIYGMVSKRKLAW